MTLLTHFRNPRALLCALPFLLYGCGGGGGGGGTSDPSSYQIGGTVSGLSASGLVLSNGSDTLSVASGSTGFAMPAQVQTGATYAVTVQTQPAGLTCSVANGSGTVGAANVGNVAVTCAANAYSLGGSISGLTTAGLVLANGGDTLTMAANANSFTLPALVAFGGGYAVTVQTQPTGLTCNVASGSGTMPAADVSNVAVTCVANSYTLGGTIGGLTGTGLVLANGSEKLTVAADAFSFALTAKVAYGSSYAVTVDTQPAGLTCSVASGSGTMPAANMPNAVVVTCAGNPFDLGGSISGLTTAGLVLANGSDKPLPVAANATSFTMPTKVAYGNTYAVTVKEPPAGLSCSVASGSGTMPAANMLNAVVTCSANGYSVGGSISGLTTSGLVLANGGDTLAVAANATSFTLPTAVAFGGSYAVTVQTQPASGSICTVASGSGTMGAANVNNVTVSCAAVPDYVRTLAGSGSIGSADGTGTAASFNYPTGLAVDVSGTVHVADFQNNKIRKITAAGVVSTLAGSGVPGSSDGTGAAASFWRPYQVAVDGGGNVYVSDYYNHKIRKITPAGVVTTLAGSGSAGNLDGTGAAASFNFPVGIAVDAGGTVYVADYVGQTIRKVTAAGVVTTLAGSGSVAFADGIGTAASFCYPTGLAVDAGGMVYVGDSCNNRIRKIDGSTGAVTTLAGSGVAGNIDGIGTAASFNSPYGVAVDGSGNVYVTDSLNPTLRKITPAGVVTTLAGSGSVGSADGSGAAASFDTPHGVAVDANGNVYVADYANQKIRKFTP